MARLQTCCVWQGNTNLHQCVSKDENLNHRIWVVVIKRASFPQVLDAESMQVVRKIEAVSTVEQNRPRIPVIISECGEL